jgi:hypothetical protein
LIFLLNGISIGCSAILIGAMIKDVRPVMEQTMTASYQQIRAGAGLIQVLKENPMIMLFIVAISGYYATYQMYVYLMPLDLAAIHGESGAVIFGTVTSINCIVVVIFTPIITNAFSKRSEPSKCLIGMILLLSGFAMFAFCKGIIPVYYISMTILTLGEVFTMLSESPYITRRIPASHRGRINGFFSIVRTGFASIYQVFVGIILAAAGSRTTWIVVLCIGAAFVILNVLLTRMDR